MASPTIIDFKKATVKIKDGTTPTPLEITLRMGDGTLSYTEEREIEYKKNRGVLDSVREGEEQPVSVTLSATLASITGMSGDPPTVKEVLDGTGAAAAWVSTGGACEPYAVDLEVTFDYTDCTGVDNEVYTFPDFRWESREFNFEDGMINFSGHCNVTVINSTRPV